MNYVFESKLDNIELNKDNIKPVVEAQWYILQVYSGFEASVVAEIRQKLYNKPLEAQMHDIVIPIKEVVKVKRGKKVTIKKNFLPGYVLINMQLTEDLVSLIRSVAKVSGFLGTRKGDVLPKAVSVEEIGNILQSIQETAEKNNVLDGQFVVGESVIITEGPFATFSGTIEDVDKEKHKLKLSVSIFERLVPVELDFNQVEKENSELN